MLLVAGFVGSLFATGVFLVVAINIATISSGADNVELRIAIIEQLKENRFILVVGITTLSGLILAFWAFRQVSDNK